MQSSFVLHKFFFMFLLHYPWTTRTAAEGPNITCSRKCGDLTVPYPFGIGINSSCSINPFFAINCDKSSNPPKALLSKYNFEVLNISDTEIRIKNRMAAWCYDDPYGEPLDIAACLVASLLSSPFSLSTENKLTVVGCHDSAVLLTTGNGHEQLDPISSCSALCSKPGELSDGFCSGIGCCQSSIPEGIQFAIISLSGDAHTKIHNFSSCGYSFLAEKSSYIFNASDISDSSFVSRILETVPIVIDWVIGNHTCNEIENSSEIICQQNSVCVDSGSILGGYRCSCYRGYEGNPYLSPGCQG